MGQTPRQGRNQIGADAVVEAGDADPVAFGRLCTSYPDLPRRFEHGYPLTPYDRSTFWGGTEHGNTDYPAHDDDQIDAGMRLSS